MTQYAVAVSYVGDVIVECDTPEEARAEVESQLPNRLPDSDFYFTEITDIREEQA